MPLSPRSRYSQQPVFTATDTNGKPRPTVAMRLVPPPPTGAETFRHTITGVQTVEYLASRYLNRSEDWWQIADANPVFFPLDLTTGEALVIPSGDDAGRVVRDRRF